MPYPYATSKTIFFMMCGRHLHAIWNDFAFVSATVDNSPWTNNSLLRFSETSSKTQSLIQLVHPQEVVFGNTGNLLVKLPFKITR